MSVRMHITRAKTGSRRSHHRAAVASVVRDGKTGTTSVRHRADPVTGMYRGKKIIDVTKKVAKIEKRKAAKEEKQKR